MLASKKKSLKKIDLYYDFKMGCDPPREIQNIKRFISHYDFRMGCDPSPLFIIQMEVGGGSHPKMKLGGETRSPRL